VVSQQGKITEIQNNSEDAYTFSPNEGSAGTDGISDKYVASRVKIKSSSSEAAVSHLLMM